MGDKHDGRIRILNINLLYDLDLLLGQVGAISGSIPELAREAQYLQKEIREIIEG